MHIYKGTDSALLYCCTKFTRFTNTVYTALQYLTASTENIQLKSLQLVAERLLILFVRKKCEILAFDVCFLTLCDTIDSVRVLLHQSGSQRTNALPDRVKL